MARVVEDFGPGLTCSIPGSGTPTSEGSPRAWRGGRIWDDSGREVKHRSPKEELEVVACF